MRFLIDECLPPRMGAVARCRRRLVCKFVEQSGGLTCDPLPIPSLPVATILGSQPLCHGSRGAIHDDGCRLALSQFKSSVREVFRIR